MERTSGYIAVVGAGYWGKNLVRNFFELGVLHTVCDTREEILRDVQAKYGVNISTIIQPVLHSPEVRGVVIAAPAAQHYNLAKKCLVAGKDVFVEKPLALNAAEGQDLVRIAHEHSRILMVGHILQYHPAILALKKMIREGELGRIQYIYSSRLNLGKLRTEEDILWSFAPHDIAAILHLLNEMPTRISTHGGNYLHSANVDTTLTTCDFNSGVKAHIFVSWLHPFKEQKFAIVGGKRMAVFDDMESERKLVLYAHRIDWVERMPIAHKDDGYVVPLPKEEPLHCECVHFLDCIRNRTKPRTCGETGVEVLRVLEACERSLRANGQPVAVQTEFIGYFAHPTAVIDPGCEIGAGTKIWHFSHVMSGGRLGENCNVGQNVLISSGAKIGNNVKIQNNVSVYTGVELEDDVFCGPSMVFNNVINPRSHVLRKHEYRRTLVKSGASIGANATIVCGVTLGKCCFVGAGAVVTRDVPNHALVVGVPAEQIGWMCYCGIRLPSDGTNVRCPDCGRHYTIEQDSCREVLVPGTPPASPFVTEAAA